MKRAKMLLLLLGVLLLAGCAGGGETAQTETADITEVTMVVTEDTIGELEQYPNLQKADLTGSTCYAALESYALAHPQVEVVYTVDLGGVQPKSTESELTLESCDQDLLLNNLGYFPKLQEVHFPQI